MRDSNFAFITKLGWQIYTKLVMSKYLRGRRITDFQRTAQSSSWIWQGIRKCKDSLDNGLCFKIGQNSCLNLREDPWLPLQSNYRLPSDLGIPENLQRLRDLMNDDRITWNM